MIAAAVMNPNVVAVTADLAVDQIASLLITRGISAVPVVDAERRVIGMVEVEDLVRAREESSGRPAGWWSLLPGAHAGAERSLRGLRAREVMSRDLVTVEEDTPIRTLIELLARRRIKRVPVVRDGRLAGLVTRVDVLRALNVRLPRHGSALNTLLSGRAAQAAVPPAKEAQAG